MRTLTISGHSDDIVHVGSVGSGEEEFYGPAMKVEDASASGIGLIVLASYGVVNGCWGFGIAPLDEDVPLPKWPIRYRAEGYTAVLEIDVPEGVWLVGLDERGQPTGQPV